MPTSKDDECDSDSLTSPGESSLSTETNDTSFADSVKGHDHGEHIVQFYDTQEYLLKILLSFIVPILSTKDAAVVIATKDHLDGLEERLRARGVPVEKKRSKGQLVMADAHRMLDDLMGYGDGTPLSFQPVASLLQNVGKRFANIYVYGELVNVLCSRGDHTSAVTVEEMFNGLMQVHKFTLLCGYDMSNFKDAHLEMAFREVCCTHSRVSPVEDYSPFQSSNERDTTIATWKQKAIALETEVERRKAVEAALQRYLELLSTRAEESLRNEHESYHMVLSALPVGIYSASMTDDDDDEVFINKRFCELTGLTESTLRVSGWIIAVHVDDRELVRHLWDVSSDSFGGKEEYRYVLSNGTLRWVTGQTVQCTTHEGKARSYVHTTVDITNLKEAERQREKASRRAEELLRHRAESAERHKREQDQFIDTLCHELRNPLSSIHGNVELLQLGLESRESVLASEHLGSRDLKRLREQVRWDSESITAIEKCVAHQKIITDDVLSLSKLEVGKVTLRRVEFNPKVVLADVGKMFEVEANRKGLNLRFNLPVSDLVVMGDPDRVSQVLINLLANALKFTIHGSITLALDFEERKDGKSFVRVSVKDSGIGLTTQEQAKLFHRFMQPASTSYEEDNGSGLGLVISKGIVELMGGTISVNSVKGQGSEFTFTFLSDKVGFSRSALPVMSANTPKPRQHRRIHQILLVEDNSINQRYLVRLLESFGYKCSTAGNGVDALACIERNPFDLILMDVHMPVMDGIATTREIRVREAKKNLSSIPIIGLSGNAREEHKQDALKSGMSYYLIKPCGKDELCKVIDKFDQ